MDEETAAALTGNPNFTPAEVCAAVGMDGFPYDMRPKGPPDPSILLTGEFWQQSYYYPARPASRFFPPRIAVHGMDQDRRIFVEHGLMKEPKDLKLFDEWLPDPDHPARFEKIQEWYHQYGGDHLNVALIHLGTEDVVQAMGLDTLAFAAYDDPQFLHDVVYRYSEWCARTAEHVNEIDADLVLALNDVADNHGPWVSPDMFREFFLKPMQEVCRRIKKPWHYHTEGNFLPLLPDLLTLGMNGFQALQPGPIDIAKFKQDWGDKLILHGNIDLDVLGRASEEEVEETVRYTISVAAPGGGYIISAAGGLPDYVKPENVRAMGRAIEKYGYYPLTV